MTQQATVNINTQKALGQQQIEEKRQQAMIEQAHKQQLALIDVNKEIRVEEIKLESKRREQLMNSHFKVQQLAADAQHDKAMASIDEAASGSLPEMTPLPPPPIDHTTVLILIL